MGNVLKTIRANIHTHKILVGIASILFFSQIYKHLGNDHFYMGWANHPIKKPHGHNEGEDWRRDPLNFNNWFTSIYVSTVYQTTLGLGDIHPASQIARYMVVSQSILSMMIFLA